MRIFQEDINEGIDPLPVRQGCGAVGGCACSGWCRKIIGYISLSEYNAFMSTYVSPESFVRKNMTEITKEESNTINHPVYLINLGGKYVEDRLFIVKGLKDEFKLDIQLINQFVKSGYIREIDNKELFDTLVANEDKIKDFFKDSGSTIEFTRRGQ